MGNGGDLCVCFFQRNTRTESVPETDVLLGLQSLHTAHRTSSLTAGVSSTGSTLISVTELSLRSTHVRTQNNPDWNAAAGAGLLTCSAAPHRSHITPQGVCGCCLSILFLAWYRLTASLLSRLVCWWRSGSSLTFSQCRRLTTLWRCLARSWATGNPQGPCAELGKGRSLPGGGRAPAPARQHKTGSAQATTQQSA